MIGQTISHYKILEKLGEGGMGVVYKAEDTRLDRPVALKFLPPALATQEAAKKRFIHEAKAASSLEHPNICAVHDIAETDDGQMFIAMPHYEGETLQKKIAGEPLEIEEVIDIVMQLASGLTKAHEQGIVHRDIKPGNIFVTKDGHVKILDFGLAKLATQTRLTKSGTTVGTVAYMSPEQASGGDVDARSDIFSLGSVFYELLTGALPFKGDHEAAIIYGILHNDPEPLRVHRNDTPERIQRIIDMALAKNTDERYQSIQEFKEAIAELGLQTGAQAHVPSRSGAAASLSSFRRIVPWIVLGGALLTIAFFVMRNAVRTPSPDSSQPVSATHTQLTFTGDAKEPIISPDGQFVAYLRDTGSEKELLVRDLGGGEPISLLDGISEYFMIRWSVDSSRLVATVRRHGELGVYVVPRLGGSVRRLEWKPYAAWSPDGKQLAVSAQNAKKISFVDVSTGVTEEDSLKLEFPFAWLWDLDWSPDASRFALHVTDSRSFGHEIWVVGVGGDDPVRVVAERELLSPRWSPSGESIYYVVPTGATQALWRVGVDRRSGEVTGEPALLLSGVTGLVSRFQSGTQLGSLAFTRDGKAFTYARHLVDRDLWMFSTEEKEEDGTPVSKRVTTGTALDDWPSVSPDGNHVAFVRVMGEASNIFVAPIEGGAARQITFMDSECFNPVWSPDGEEIAFVSYEKERYRLWRVAATGGAARVFENMHLYKRAGLTWSPGENILHSEPRGRNIMILDPDTGEESPLLENEEAGYIFIPVISPDRRFAAFTWNRKGREEDGVWLMSLEDLTQTPVLMGDAHPCGWSGDSQWIYYDDMPAIGRVRTDGSGNEMVLTIPFEDVDRHPRLAMSPDARYVLGAFKVKIPSDIWLVENFDPDVPQD